MKMRFISMGCVLALAVTVFTACGNGSGGGGATPTAASTEAASIINTVAASVLTDALQYAQQPQADVQAQVAKFKAVNVLTCQWLDANGTALPHATPQEIVDSLDQVVMFVCQEACTGGGTQTYTVSNTDNSPLFVGTPFANGLVNQVTYDECPVENVCGTNTLDGTITITATDFLTAPCQATVTIVSTDMMIDGTTLATVNMILNFTAAGGCDTVTTFACDDVLNASSTMTVGGVTYNKDDICDMINNPTCP